MRIVRLPFAAVLLALGLASPLVAQSTALSGRVVDAETGAPLSGATVQVSPDRRTVMTDANGAFRISLRAGRDYVLSASQLGYTEESAVVSILAGGPTVSMTFSLAPEPLVLEAVEVLVDRFEARRNRTTMSSSVLNRERLARFGGGSLMQAVRSGGMLMSTTCAGARSARGFLTGWSLDPTGGSFCVAYRGGVIAPRVYIDDRPAFGGVDELHAYSPSETHHVEIYGRGTMIRVYTLDYVERMARSNRRLPSLNWW